MKDKQAGQTFNPLLNLLIGVLNSAPQFPHLNLFFISAPPNVL